MDSIDYEHFSKVELRIGTVVEAEKIENSEKLLKLQVSLGDEKRQILAGISQYYSPDDITGKQVVVVANLEPRTMMGEQSQGMLLAAGEEKPVLLTASETVEEGARVR